MLVFFLCQSVRLSFKLGPIEKLLLEKKIKVEDTLELDEYFAVSCRAYVVYIYGLQRANVALVMRTHLANLPRRILIPRC